MRADRPSVELTSAGAHCLMSVVPRISFIAFGRPPARPVWCAVLRSRRETWSFCFYVCRDGIFFSVVSQLV